jgi:hypothetical protein
MSTDTQTKRIELPPELQGEEFLSNEQLSRFFTPEEIDLFWHQQLGDLLEERLAELEYPLTEEELAEAGRRLGIE